MNFGLKYVVGFVVYMYNYLSICMDFRFFVLVE